MNALTYACFAVVLASLGVASAPKVDHEGKAWLDRYKEPAAINVDGLWHSDDWGDVILEQAEGAREVTGSGDGWDINGVVSGGAVYLLFSDDGEVNYSAELTDDHEKRLRGVYSSGLMHEKSKKKPMLLTR